MSVDSECGVGKRSWEMKFVEVMYVWGFCFVKDLGFGCCIILGLEFLGWWSLKGGYEWMGRVVLFWVGRFCVCK